MKAAMDFRGMELYCGAQKWRSGMDALHKRRVWLVFRTDDNGNRVMVKDQYDLSESDADFTINALSARGHKQIYEKLSYFHGKLAAVLMESDIRMP